MIDMNMIEPELYDLETDLGDIEVDKPIEKQVMIADFL